MMKRAFVLVIFLLIGSQLISADPKDLVGIWKAKRNFGPEVRGELIVTRNAENWQAEIAGHRVNAKVDGKKIDIKLPGKGGEFIGKILANSISGHWIQPPQNTNGTSYASPVELKANGKSRWIGEVIPIEDEFTLYLNIQRKEDGTLTGFIRNPDRNLGVFLNVNRIEMNGNTVKLIGPFIRNKNETTLAEGAYHPDDGILSLYIGNRGGTYDFLRVDDDSTNGFYARGKNPPPYIYQPPPAEDDGWPISTLHDVGISLEPIKDFIEHVIEPAPDSIHSPYIHGMLIARHGKLVFEEYFHGFHRNQPHDSRSASKSLTSLLVGAAIQSGTKLQADSSVYDVIYGKDLPADIDPRKRKMTVEHLLTQASGFNCDDDDSNSPGNEDNMQQQTADLDWYHYTLSLSMIREPGEKSVYCSINPNLLGDVLIHATHKSLLELFQELIATPLQIKQYYLNLQPTGEPYMGGGIQWMPRDFMKLPQLILNGGMWNGRRVITKEWAERSVSSLTKINDREYGYLWWLADYPYKGRTIRAFFAAGNGGQIMMGIPELDLVIAFYAGHYSDRAALKIQQEFIPKYILPAIQ